MSDPMTTLTLAGAALAGLGIATFAGLARLAGLARGAAAGAGRRAGSGEPRSPAGEMIEVADLKERVRKLEAIAAVVDL